MAHQAITPEMTDLEFTKEVMSLLARELGPGGYARYLMLHHSGTGDYTLERQNNPDTRTVDEVWQELQSFQAAQTPSRSSASTNRPSRRPRH